jgi:hypothetical protein
MQVRGLKLLNELMPPPACPIDAAGDWRDGEASLGTGLPEDYKQFIRLYGTGAIGKMPVWVFNALTQQMKDYNEVVQDAYGKLFEDSPELLPYPLFPRPGGLLYWGATGNGDYLHWLTSGPPNEWTVVVHDFGDMEFMHFNMGMVAFLLSLLRRETELFPGVFFQPPVVFTPSNLACTWP